MFNKNILITGSSGLIGVELSSLLLSKYKDFNICRLSSTKDCIIYSKNDCRSFPPVNLMNYSDIQTFCSLFFIPNIIIHLAAKVGGLYDNMSSNYRYFNENIMMNTNILNISRHFNVSLLINTLSTCIFPKNCSLPLNKNEIHDGLPDSSNIGYSYAKRLLDIGSKILSDEIPINIINLIPTNLYGTNDNYNLKQGHVIPVLIHKIYNSIVKNEDLIINGDGSALRQFVYAKDFANIIYLLLDDFLTKNIEKKTGSCDNYIVSCCQEISIKDLVQILLKTFKLNNMIFKNDVVFDNLKSNGVISKKSCLDPYLEGISSDFKFMSFRDGLNETIKYFIENYNDIRK